MKEGKYTRVAAVLLAFSLMSMFSGRALAHVTDMGTVAQLRVGDEIFWDGEVVVDSNSPLGNCADATAECFEYKIEVTESGGLLRVAVDDPSGYDTYWLRLFSPSGALAFEGANVFTTEGQVGNPEVGVWTAQVVPTWAASSTFRMRAALQREPKDAHGRVRDLLPNLRLTPPFEMTLSPNTNWFFPTRVDALGEAGVSCHPDEIVDHDPKRCLRFSLGPQNVGQGPLELVYRAMEGVTEPGTIYQVIERSDGSSYQRPAGPFEYHKTHAHYHHEGFGTLELYRVTDEKKGEFEKAGEGPKQGFCMLSYMIVNWGEFDQAKPRKNASCEPNGGAAELFKDGSRMWLDAGWSDIYAWTLPGNYVDFGTNGDGLYIVRSTADAKKNILESDESDNTGYAYIEVKGSSVNVIERGYGESPWDPHKSVVEDWLPLNPEDDWVPFVPGV